MHSFDDSQKAAYESVMSEPIFKNGWNDVQVNFLLHVVNFFKYHLTQAAVLTAHPAYSDLPEASRPQSFDGPLSNGDCKLGKTWMGTFGKSLSVRSLFSNGL